MKASDRRRAPATANSIRSVMLACLIGLCAMVTPSDRSGPAAEEQPVTEAAATPAFPLHVAPGGRYLEDAAGRPFLIKGDTAWSLIAQLSREDAELYLEDRRARGFNTILVNLLEARFATNAPANIYGEPPFTGVLTGDMGWLDELFEPGRVADFDRPNEAYFAHADWILRRAAEKGFLVLLAPAYVGWDGGDEGWYQAMKANGPDRLRRYGAFLGRRYRDLDNILWVHAGDYNPPDRDLVRAIAEGIREFDPQALHTAHQAPQTTALDYWPDEPWLGVNTVYSYSEAIHAAALAQYLRPDALPFFLIESGYENEHESSEQDLRRQAYQALLSGAAGQVFGNNPIWHFDGPGLYPAPTGWKDALASRGAWSMTHLHELLGSLPWWRLHPDSDGTLLVEGLGPEDDRAVAALADEGSFALLYLPSSRRVTLDLGQLAGPRVVARWYDPSDGRYLAVPGSPFPSRGMRQFTPDPESNGSGFDDWALLLESQE